MPDGSQMYSHTLSTFLHPLKKLAAGSLFREPVDNLGTRELWRRTRTEARVVCLRNVFLKEKGIERDATINYDRRQR